MYHCELCNYETDDRDRINLHHIKPKNLNGCDNKYNLIYLCPNCHSKVYIFNSKGTHGIKGSNPIIINGKLLSSGGMIVDYIEEDIQKYSLLKNMY